MSTPDSLTELTNPPSSVSVEISRHHPRPSSNKLTTTLIRSNEIGCEADQVIPNVYNR